MNKMNYLTEIIKRDGEFYLRYEIPTQTTHTIALPVYTNVDSMIEGKVSSSKYLRKPFSSVKSTTVEDEELTDVETAQMLFNLFLNNNMIDPSKIQRSDLSGNWTVFIEDK